MTALITEERKGEYERNKMSILKQEILNILENAKIHKRLMMDRISYKENKEIIWKKSRMNR